MIYLLPRILITLNEPQRLSKGAGTHLASWLQELQSIAAHHGGPSVHLPGGVSRQRAEQGAEGLHSLNIQYSVIIFLNISGKKN